jgi:hypothetical protein
MDSETLDLAYTTSQGHFELWQLIEFDLELAIA